MTLALPSNVPMMTAESRMAMSTAMTSPTHDLTSDDCTAATHGSAADAVVFSVELHRTTVDAESVAAVIDDEVDWSSKNAILSVIISIIGDKVFDCDRHCCPFWRVPSCWFRAQRTTAASSSRVISVAVVGTQQYSRRQRDSPRDDPVNR